MKVISKWGLIMFIVCYTGPQTHDWRDAVATVLGIISASVFVYADSQEEE